MKKLLLLFMSMFAILGTSMAQDKGDGKDEGNGAFALEYSMPANGEYTFIVRDIYFKFNKGVVVTLPEAGIEVKNSATGEVVKITRLFSNEDMDKSEVRFLFEQKSVYDEKDKKEQLVEQEINTPGEWSYTIPAGCIKSVDSEEFAEQTFTFNIATSMEIESVSPVGEVTKLDKIEVTFPKAIETVNTSKLSLLDNYWMPVSAFKSEVTYSDDRKTVTLELETPVTTPGTYNLDIYQGVFVSEDGTLNNYKYVSFQVIDPAPSFSTNLNDGDKKKVDEMPQSLEITFKNVNEVKLVEGADPVLAYIPGGTELEGTATYDAGKITVTFDEKFTEIGDYTFYIPKGLFTMDGVENESRTMKVTMYEFEIKDLEIVSITPAAGDVNKIEMIIIEFNQEISLSIGETGYISNKIVLKGDTKDYVLTYAPSGNGVSTKVEYLANAEWNGFEYSSTPVTEAGTYTLDMKDVIVDYAGEDVYDDGYIVKNWHRTNACIDKVYTWTISENNTPAPEIDLTKVYRVKDVNSNKYLHIGNYDAHPGGAVGGVKVEANEESRDQVFTIEDAGAGQYYLKSLEGHYIVCRSYNVDGSMEEKTALGFEFINETQFYITNARGYFKVENIEGVDYTFCDAEIDKAATWVLEEAANPAGIEEITAGDVEKRIYDLTGRRVENVTNAGIYIVNGKKVLVK